MGGSCVSNRLTTTSLAVARFAMAGKMRRMRYKRLHDSSKEKRLASGKKDASANSSIKSVYLLGCDKLITEGLEQRQQFLQF